MKGSGPGSTLPEKGRGTTEVRPDLMARSLLLVTSQLRVKVGLLDLQKAPE